MININQIKPLLTQKTVAELLSYMGYSITRDYKFVNDISFSISPNGYIKDFGGTGFGGDIFSFIMKEENITFSKAVEIVADNLELEEFKNFKIDLSKKYTFNKTREKSYDLNSIFNNLQNDSIPKGYISKLFDLQILKNNPKNKEIRNRFIYYSKYYDSLAIVLRNKDEIETIAINRVKNKDGTIIKWKTFGSKSYIQYKIKDNFIFIVYGMGEIIICELLDISYIAFQSDSISKNLQNNYQWVEEIKPTIQDKYLILLLDNDESCRKTIIPIKEEMANPENVIVIEMLDLEHIFLTDKMGIVSLESKKEWIEKHNDIFLENGYDFRDFCNDVKKPQIIEQILKITIKAKYGF